ncbi:multiheme c-type cytochrome [Vibrio diazotrophicus]|uniref:multiheme c-type cytochrome n=1 Tax=Vibrio diazotrophicus TaxID=685 RepID=UPI0005AB3A65|nr:multiheme c-type cytochrome [Vibrio diazotrophicus]
MCQWANLTRFIFIIISVLLNSCPTFAQSSSTDTEIKPISVASYVGTDACIDCHIQETNAWKGSHHDMAMKHANDKSVRGNFDDQIYHHNGKQNRFFRKGEEYWVNIQGPDHQWHDFKISYTFGWEPLQQYMVEFNDGRIQLIPFAWDTRSKLEGGQRWFHLYPDTTNSDEFYWTNTGQNWNYMCADCHSTDLKKNYNPITNTYMTTWAEINVGCEACHGPASKHIALIENANSDLNLRTQLHGFERDLSNAVSEWVTQQGHSTLQPKEISKTDQIKTCAQCHSRRTQLNETGDHVKGSFFNKYRLSLITPELYYPDGQIYDEDYVYGSFLQSEMAEKGVTCTNCHDPHSADLKMPKETVCLQCHISSQYTSDNHTFHAESSEASQCTTCHMPETIYMQVDSRRDHGWHVPRPDLSEHIETPNACTSCHEDKNNLWADQQIAKWFPNSKYRNRQHFSVAFYADMIGHQGADKALAYLAQDTTLKDIIRGSALERMAGSTGQNTTLALVRSVKSDNEMIRLGTIAGSSGYPFRDRWRILSPLLVDSVLSIRAEAAAALVHDYSEMDSQQRSKLNKPLEEYMKIQEYNLDRGFGRTNLANIYRSLGENERAIKLYNEAIEIEPYYENSYVNLADLYRSTQNESRAFAILEQGLKAQPKSSMIPYSAGLSLLRQGNEKSALEYLKKATENAPNNPNYWYVYGLSLEKTDVLKASKALDTAFKISRNPDHLYVQCELLARNYQAGAIAFSFERCKQQLRSFVPERVIDLLNSIVQQN